MKIKRKKKILISILTVVLSIGIYSMIVLAVGEEGMFVTVVQEVKDGINKTVSSVLGSKQKSDVSTTDTKTSDEKDTENEKVDKKTSPSISYAGLHTLTYEELKTNWNIDESDPAFITINDVKDENLTGFEKIIIPGEINGKQIKLGTIKYSPTNSIIPMFQKNIQELRFQVENGKKVICTSGKDLFNGLGSLTNIDLSGLDTSQVTDMSSMFSDCLSLTSLDVSNFDTKKVTTMSWMFQSCTTLTSLDLSNFDTSQVIDMAFMFSGCANLINLNVSSFNISKVSPEAEFGAGMLCMFEGCKRLLCLDLSNFDVKEGLLSETFETYDKNSPLLIISNNKELSNYDYIVDNRRKYAITYNAGEGYFAGNQKIIEKQLSSYTYPTLDAANKEVTELEAASVEIPTRAGYVFAGWEKTLAPVPPIEKTWNLEKTSLENIYARANATYTAKWKVAPYEVTFDPANGTSSTTSNVNAGDLIIEPTEPKKDGFVFAGWFNGGTEWNFATSKMPDHNITLTAHWNPNRVDGIFTGRDSVYFYYDDFAIKDGNIGLSIPKSIALYEKSTSGQGTVRLVRLDGKDFPNDLNVEVTVMSQNGGYLNDGKTNIAKYTMSVDTNPVPLNTSFEHFYRFTNKDLQASSDRKIVKQSFTVNVPDTTELNKKEAIYKDQLTFGIHVATPIV